MHKHAVTDQPILDIYARRWSPRAFGPDPVPEELLRVVFEAARWAPSAFNEQPWRFIVARREEGEAFERMLSCLTPANQVWARLAPVLGLGLVRNTYSYNGKANRHAWHDLGLASAQLIGQAMALDLYAHLMAGIEAGRIRELYAVPGDYEPVTGIALGYLGDEDQLPDELRQQEREPRHRKGVAEWLYSGDWGNPRYGDSGGG